ncbi:MAG: hypothetical protein WCO12_03630 [bacterium]
MDHISLFLKKFENLGFKELLIKEEIVKIVEKKCGVKILMKDVVYKDGQLSIKGSRSLKSELFLKKQEIIDEIENTLSKTKIHRLQ